MLISSKISFVKLNLFVRKDRGWSSIAPRALKRSRTTLKEDDPLEMLYERSGSYIKIFSCLDSSMYWVVFSFLMVKLDPLDPGLVQLLSLALQISSPESISIFLGEKLSFPLLAAAQFEYDMAEKKSQRKTSYILLIYPYSIMYG